MSTKTILSTATASSLATYINSHSARFKAEILQHAGQVWVLVRDRDSKPRFSTRYIEPILDVRTYLEREDRPQPLPPEFRTLLEAWLKQS